MLARFDERAPLYDRENRFFDEDFEELQAVRATCSPPCRPSSAAPGSASTSTSQLAAPARLRRAGDRARRQHALLLDRASPPTCCAGRRRLVPLDPREGRRGRGVLRAARRGRQRPPAAARRRDGRAGRRRLGDLRPQDLRQPLAGVDLRRLPRDGHVRPRRTRRSCTASCRATPTGYQIIDTWDTLGMRATQSQDTVLDKAFVPDELVALVCPAGLRRRRPVPGRRSSPGR